MPRKLFRKYLAVAAIVTWYTNPVTILPLYYVAYKLGLFVTGSQSAAPPRFDFQVFDLPVMEWLPAAMHWSAAMGKPFATGLVLLALILAVAGYLLVMAAWRAQVLLAWRKRRRSRLRPCLSERVSARNCAAGLAYTRTVKISAHLTFRAGTSTALPLNHDAIVLERRHARTIGPRPGIENTHPQS
jgi:hypothetical protein